MKNTMIAIAAAGAVLLTTAPFAQASDEKGMQVFRAQKCTQCHSIGVIGNKKGALDEIGSKLTAAEIKAWITDPDGMRARTQPPPTRKPVMKKLPIPAGDVDALVAMLKDLKKP